jgi:glycosyltransferase involved in cell wall biosynthesis
MIGIIIPLYNKGKYISRALDSVFAQTWRDYEIIVVDDGSIDNGPEVVSKYKDSRLRMIVQKNAGPGAARNRGIKENKNPYVTFLDADDEWMPTFLEKSLNAIKSNPDCDLAVSAWYQDRSFSNIGSKDNRADMSTIFRSFGIKEGPWRLPVNATDIELKHMLDIFCSITIFCKRGLIEKYGGFYTKAGSTYGEDNYLWLQLIFNHKIFRIMEPLAWYHNCIEGLSFGGPRYKPLESFLTDPEPIRRKCPAEYRNLLERWFAQYALHYANIRASFGKSEDAEYLEKNFPLMKIWRWKYAKLKFKLMFPRIIPIIKSLKTADANCI